MWRQPFALDLALRLLEHLGRQVDAGHLAVLRIGVQREPRADADLEDFGARRESSGYGSSRAIRGKKNRVKIRS